MSNKTNTKKDQRKTDQPRVKKDGTPWAKPTVDERPASVIFAERVDDELRLISRRFQNLEALGNARRAAPTEAQMQVVEQYLRDGMERAIAALRSKLTAEESKVSTKQGEFSLVKSITTSDGHTIAPSTNA